MIAYTELGILIHGKVELRTCNCSSISWTVSSPTVVSPFTAAAEAFHTRTAAKMDRKRSDFERLDIMVATNHTNI